MKRIIAIGWVTALILMAAACNRTVDLQTDGAQAIQNTETQWNHDYVSRDPDKIVAYYADNAVLMAPGMPPSIGKDSIRTTIHEMVSDPALTLKFHAAKIEVAQSGDLGYAQGSYTMTMTDPHTNKIVADRGSYVTTYHKESDGQWKAVADIATSEVPPGPPTSSM
jgi:uncharacterized protein (TIGR02246 family)